ncbi:hypothetical protein ASPTUDRAFT_696516 [Aspergillus tubingensis CBS 134.48]|uniref:Uncharacterized protein n=4 Tax=Aspergillus subgen. Circumdati TaxID=2720871 RepID=A0A1L9N0W1_ASPTC|nr:hypothetical protein ASPTUDRAFT_696516 [Aspergillus tubingensis CBS 134.48]
MAASSVSSAVNFTLPSSSSGSSIKRPIKTVSKPCFGCDCGDEECDCCVCTVMWYVNQKPEFTTSIISNSHFCRTNARYFSGHVYSVQMARGLFAQFDDTYDFYWAHSGVCHGLSEAGRTSITDATPCHPR